MEGSADYERCRYSRQAVISSVSVTASLVRCDVLMAVRLHLKSHLLAIEKFT